MRNGVGHGNRTRTRASLLGFAPLAHAYMIFSETIHSVPARCAPW
jgi:hypothetical protein